MSKITKEELKDLQESTSKINAIRHDIGLLSTQVHSLNHLHVEEISKQEAETLLKLCEKTIVSKTRFEVSLAGHLFEVDEFAGPNEGLVIAEVELDSEDEEFSKPDWLGREVTGEKRYYNSNLSKQPFIGWD